MAKKATSVPDPRFAIAKISKALEEVQQQRTETSTFAGHVGIAVVQLDNLRGATDGRSHKYLRFVAELEVFLRRELAGEKNNIMTVEMAEARLSEIEKLIKDHNR